MGEPMVERGRIDLLEDLLVHGGAYESVQIGVFSVAAVALGDCGVMPLRDVLGISPLRIRLFESREEATDWLTEEAAKATECWSEERRQQLIERLLYADGFERGRYTAPDGTVYRRRGDHFYPEATASAERMFRLAAYGGCLGLHKFAEGRVFAGLGYFLTAGGFGLGVATDLLFFLLGMMKDRHKRYYARLEDKKKSLRIFLAGLICTAVYCIFYCELLKSVLIGEITLSGLIPFFF